MCWSGEASAVLAATGLASTTYFYIKGESKTLCAALAYFSLMELLQAYTYTVIDECLNPANQAATFLGYLHITFQPFFINAVALYFVPQSVRRKIEIPVYLLCAVAAILFLLRIYPFEGITYCYDMTYNFALYQDIQFAMPFCGKEICSVSGDWHIAWQIPANGNLFLANTFVYAAFLLPLLYGSWKMVLYHFLTGPLLAYLTTNSMNEWAAVWCLYSIGLLFLLIKTPIRRLIHVESWYGIKYPGRPFTSRVA